MVEATEIAPDIAILLAQTWRSQIDESIGYDSICRIWAFDFGWFDMETALRVRDNLIQTGWLDASEQMVQSGVDLGGVDIPFGWLPSMRILESPPPVQKIEVLTEIKNVEPEVPPIKQTVNQRTIDPAVTHTTDLLDQIAEAAGLDRKEIMRRAQRKRRALGPVTLWMALLLVAREQQLPMSGFVRTITT
ncbi:MAG: DUF2240 family protein [Candidatus Thermoplasmatota archaeon]|nr:DUF2240 family protein [Candidatus Thermoplasmatota archaeon]